MRNIFLLMEEGDSYHGTRAVMAFSSQEEALKEADRLTLCEQNSPPRCGSEECDHNYTYNVYPVSLSDVKIKERCEHIIDVYSTQPSPGQFEEGYSKCAKDLLRFIKESSK